MASHSQAAHFAPAKSDIGIVPDLFSFEEMTTLSNAARILSLFARGNANLTPKSPAAAPWLDVCESGAHAAEFKLLAAHPRLLGPARQAVNSPVRAAHIQLWVADRGRAATPQAGADEIQAIVCLAGAARIGQTTTRGPVLRCGSVVWTGIDTAMLLEPEPGAPPTMICAITYAAMLQPASTTEAGEELHAVADTSLWPSAYVMAG